jgi:hypothetical protein
VIDMRGPFAAAPVATGPRDVIDVEGEVVDAEPAVTPPSRQLGK